jgi:hypothetical protein
MIFQLIDALTGALVVATVAVFAYGVIRIIYLAWTR